MKQVNRYSPGSFFDKSRKVSFFVSSIRLAVKAEYHYNNSCESPFAVPRPHYPSAHQGAEFFCTAERFACFLIFTGYMEFK